MPRLQMTKRGQYFLTIPEGIARALEARKHDRIAFRIDLRKSRIWIEKED